MEDLSGKVDKSVPCRTLRPYFSRSRGACMLCRQRKKKCDERKPSCWTCTRSGKKCLYPVTKSGARTGSREKELEIVTETETVPATDTVTVVDLTGRRTSNQLESKASDEETEVREDARPTAMKAASSPPPVSTMVSSGTQTDLVIPTESESARGTPAELEESRCTMLQLRSPRIQRLKPQTTESQTWPCSPRALRSRRSSETPQPQIPNSLGLRIDASSPKQTVYSDALSNNFLEHYLHMTTEILVSNTKAENPFLQYVMPLAHSDDSLMEAVVCLGGTHLCASVEDPDPAVRKATLGMYGLVLHRLREKMMSGGTTLQDRQEKLRVMTIVMLLCQIESLQRYHKGTIFPHLRAFRSLLLSLQDEMPSSFTSVEEKLQGSMLEIYSYLVLVANITPYGLDENRTLPFDSFLFSLRDKVAGLESSGVIFSSIDGLFSLIPCVSLLARQRLEEPENEPSTGLMRKFAELEQRIGAWEPPTDNTVIWDAERDSLASVYRHALLIYLKTARCGTVVGDVRVIQDVQEHVNSAIATLMSLAMSTMCAVLLWPVMIVGSCLIIKPQQNMVYEGLRYSRYKTANVLQAIELLEKLWRDPAPEAYGPYGLHYVMKKTGISLCMS